MPSAPVSNLARIPTFDHSAAAEKLTRLHRDAQNGMRRVVAFGLFCFELQEVHLKQGQFGRWLQQHAPEFCKLHSKSKIPQPSSTLDRWMELTESTLKACKLSVRKALEVLNPPSWGISHSGEALLLEDKQVPESVKPIREKIFSVIDNKSQSQLFFEFKQAEENATGKLQKKRGRLKGQGGATKEQRAAAKEAEERAEIEAMELDTKEFDKWMDKVSDAKGLPRISEKVFDKHFERVEFHYKWLQSIVEARKGGSK